MKAAVENQVRAQVHCPICTHTVGADVQFIAKRARVVPGQKCPRCSSKLDASMIVHLPAAA